jgi:hypothetical protein
MSTGRPCVICSDSEKTKLASVMIAEGASDQAIACRLGGGIHRMAVSRHRRNHIEAPAKAIAQAAAKGRDVVEQRSQVLAAAEAGDPVAFIALSEIVADLRKVHERLERTAEAAEHDNQRLAVSALSAQQLRAAEVRSRLGGAAGYAPPRGIPEGAAGGAKFSVSIIFQNAGHTETIATVENAEPFQAISERDDVDN